MQLTSVRREEEFYAADSASKEDKKIYSDAT